MMKSAFSAFTSSKRATRTTVAVVLVFLAIFPLIVESGYYMQIAILILVNATLAIAIFPLLRMGLLFVAQSAFRAVGAYTATLLVMRADMNSWAAMVIAGLAAGFAAFILSFPTLRVKGLYFLLVTFGLNQVVQVGLNNWQFVGASQGIINIPTPDPIPIPGGSSIDFTSMANYYYLALILTLIFIFIFYTLWTSHLGRLVRAINSSEDLAQGVGVNLFRYRMLIFVLSCAAAGIIGSFQAQYYRIVVPPQFDIWTSFNPMIYAIVGGIGSPIGTMLGPLFLISLTESFRFLVEYKPLVYAGTLIVVMLFFPGGLIGIFQKLNVLLKKARRLREARS